MPPTQSPTESGPPTPDQKLPQPAQPLTPPDPDAPVSFVPHEPPGQPPVPVRFRTNRYGELDEHELVRLLDTIEDERARARFRESIYISFFFWLAVAWLIFYGPRVLWHAPILISPADAIRKQELTQLNMPRTLSPNLPKSAPKPVAHPTIDAKTLKHFQEMAKSEPQPAPTPQPAAPTNSAPPAPAPTPTPRSMPSALPPDAPTPHPSATRPDFPNAPSSPGQSIQNALNNAARARSGNGNGMDFHASPSNPLGGGVEVLSDMQGVDFDPYLKRILADIKRNWLPLIPAEAEPPISKQGETFIRFTILPDGNIGGMTLDGSTHDDAINHSCWSAITSEGQFPPLPSQFHGPNLELRIHFLVNKDIGR
jgi:outer membrane biosynthesis protein TonB